MNYLILFLICFNLSAQTIERSYIISGFDDVLRQAENTGLIKAAIKILEKDQGFAGMPELYQEISREESDPHFVLVSAISHWFESRISKLLTDSHYPSHKLYLRNWLTEWSIEGFKTEKMKEIITERSHKKFIVIFDNSDASLNLSDEINKEFGDKVVSIYLRMVVDKKLPEKTVGFYTAFDIAVKEYEAGRLELQSVDKIGNALLKVRNVNELIPSYALCPKKYRPCETEMCQIVGKHVEKLCTINKSL